MFISDSSILMACPFGPEGPTSRLAEVKGLIYRLIFTLFHRDRDVQNLVCELLNDRFVFEGDDNIALLEIYGNHW